MGEGLTLSNKVKEEEYSRDVRGVKGRDRNPMDYAKTLKLRFLVGDLDLPERRKR